MQLSIASRCCRKDCLGAERVCLKVVILPEAVKPTFLDIVTTVCWQARNVVNQFKAKGRRLLTERT